MSREVGPGTAPRGSVPEGNSGKPPNGHTGPRSGLRAGGGESRRPSLGGGAPAQDRELRAQGRQTVQKLLDAGLAEFDERGFQAVRVDDVVRRAKISHGTFYLYFSNKEDLFKALLSDALVDMSALTDEFPVVTRNDAGHGSPSHNTARNNSTHDNTSPSRSGSRGSGHRDDSADQEVIRRQTQFVARSL